MASVSKREWVYKGEKKSAWVVRYVDDQGSHRSKQFDKKRDASEYCTIVAAELRTGDHIAERATLTVEKAIEGYLSANEVRLKSGQIGRTHHDHTRHYLTKHTPHWLKAKLLTRVTWSDLDKLNADLVNFSGLQPTTVKKYVVMVKGVFDHMKKKGLVKDNPVDEFLKSNRGVKAAPTRTFTIEQVTRLLEAAGQKRPKGRERLQKLMEICVHFGAFCGLRHGEILALMWRNIDLEQGIVHIRHNLTVYDELKSPKTAAGKRSVPMPRHMVPMLEAWKEYCIEDGRGLIFNQVNGYGPNGTKLTVGPWNYANFSCQWHALLKQAGLDGRDKDGRVLRFHDLRHFAASMMIERKIPLPEVAHLLGHSHFDTTLQVYAHSLAPNANRAIEIEQMAALTLPNSDDTPILIAQGLRNAPQVIEIIGP